MNIILFLLTVIILLNIILYSVFRKPKKPIAKEYDYTLVLGCPCLADGSLSSFQKRRIDATAYYFQQGYAKTILISGGSVHNQFSEAEVMAAALHELCPTADIHLETQARNTYQNLKNTKAMMDGNDILVVSGSSHLRRAYFFVRKFYPNAAMGAAQTSDPWYVYLWEYTRMWVALHWEIRLFIRNKRH